MSVSDNGTTLAIGCLFSNCVAVCIIFNMRKLKGLGCVCFSSPSPTDTYFNFETPLYKVISDIKPKILVATRLMTNKYKMFLLSAEEYGVEEHGEVEMCKLSYFIL